MDPVDVTVALSPVLESVTAEVVAVLTVVLAPKQSPENSSSRTIAMLRTSRNPAKGIE